MPGFGGLVDAEVIQALATIRVQERLRSRARFFEKQSKGSKVR